MKRLLPILCCLFILSGCARFHEGVPAGGNMFAAESVLLAEIQVERWGKNRFSGILALQSDHGDLVFSLLDTTGVTLLSGVVAGPGMTEYGGVLKKTGIGDYLGEAFWRMFAAEPATIPCSGTFLQRLCREEMEGEESLRKSMKIGPFTSWESSMKTGDSSVYIYKQPFIGVRIKVEEMEARKEEEKK